MLIRMELDRVKCKSCGWHYDYWSYDDDYITIEAERRKHTENTGHDQFEFKSKGELTREELGRKKGLPANAPIWNTEYVKSKNGILAAIVVTCNFCGYSFSVAPTDLGTLNANMTKHVKNGCI